ncbi:hypothetical protein JCM8202v2_001739 [Rhodotorula sphaerocarpa]
MASPNERLIYGAKTDSVEMMHEVLNGDAEFDVNAQDGLGNTDALSLLLERDDTDVDLQNRLDRFTPLHLAVRLEHEEARAGVTEMLLDAGADPSLKDRHGLRAQDYLRPSSSETDKEIAQMIRVAMAERTTGANATANNADLADDDDDDDGEVGSGSGSGSEEE